ncbi:MAG: hypothetical protein KAX88_04570 [Rhodoferax sp.]|nr:hypothetical protein [Rhodoferax sp.]
MTTTSIFDVQAITVWNWADAPPDLKALSDHGGDEDWIALVPQHYARDYYLAFLDHIDTRRTPQVTPHPSITGYEVWIGAHA